MAEDEEHALYKMGHFRGKDIDFKASPASEVNAEWANLIPYGYSGEKTCLEILREQQGD
jgi:hypothetical protein